MHTQSIVKRTNSSKSLVYPVMCDSFVRPEGDEADDGNTKTISHISSGNISFASLEASIKVFRENFAEDDDEEEDEERYPECNLQENVMKNLWKTRRFFLPDSLQTHTHMHTKDDCGVTHIAR